MFLRQRTTAGMAAIEHPHPRDEAWRGEPPSESFPWFVLVLVLVVEGIEDEDETKKPK
jgi:hypothetical protein